MKWYKIFDSIEEAEIRVPLNHTVKASFKSLKICIAHTGKGWFAIEDECPHLGESLSKGTINYLNEITCPWHSYRYNLEHGRECSQKTRDARVFKVEARDKGLFLGLEF
jgi:nitrite reductase/ring-hydroxylating ferredoxin subunit